jgi:hypothetical protein
LLYFQFSLPCGLFWLSPLNIIWYFGVLIHNFQHCLAVRFRLASVGMYLGPRWRQLFSHSRSDWLFPLARWNRVRISWTKGSSRKRSWKDTVDPIRPFLGDISCWALWFSCLKGGRGRKLAFAVHYDIINETVTPLY